jgi:biopolymer transport protein ExbD
VSLRDRRAGLRSRRRHQGGSSIDLTPLIDVVFQLLIFFLLTSTIENNPSFQVKLPKAKNRDTTQEPKAVMVSLGPDGTIEIEGKQVDGRELQMRLCAAAESQETSGVSIKADEATQHQHVLQVMDVAKECGLERLNILHRR